MLHKPTELQRLDVGHAVHVFTSLKEINKLRKLRKCIMELDARVNTQTSVFSSASIVWFSDAMN